MKITLIYPLRYRMNLKKTKYLPGENDFEEYIDEEMVFPLNHIIRGLIEAESSIEVILVKTVSPERNSNEAEAEAREEIKRILTDRSQDINFKVIETPYASKKKMLGKIYKDIIKVITPGSIIFADMTFGAKYMPLILFCVLNYAEKYLSCEIGRIFYGLFDSIRDNPGVIVDFTTLYLLNSFGTMFDGSKKSFDEFSGRILNE